MKKTLLLLSVILLGAASMNAQKTSGDVQMFNPVMTGVTSLTIAPDSRAGAMGDVGKKHRSTIPIPHWH